MTTSGASPTNTLKASLKIFFLLFFSFESLESHSIVQVTATGVKGLGFVF